MLLKGGDSEVNGSGWGRTLNLPEKIDIQCGICDKHIIEGEDFFACPTTSTAICLECQGKPILPCEKTAFNNPIHEHQLITKVNYKKRGEE